jgi:UDP-glucose-4-epimerase GalE
VLITGGAGYIGSHTAQLLSERGREVWIYDNLSYGHVSAIDQDRLIVGDLADAGLLEQVLRERAIEAVIHFAAFINVGESAHDPQKYYQNNLVNSLNLLAAMRRADVARLVFSSTCATYGVPLRTPITEDEPQKPINAYGRAKLAVEWALADYSQAYGLSYAALRYFNAAGASADGRLGEDHDPETHLIPLILQVALRQRSHIQVFGTDYPTPDGTCVRDYIHVEDLAAAHLLALDKLQPSSQLAYNIGAGRGCSVREVIQVCEQVTCATIPVVEAPRRPGDPAVLVADPSKAMHELGWKPRYKDLRSIIEPAWRWHQRHPHGYQDRIAR